MKLYEWLRKVMGGSSHIARQDLASIDLHQTGAGKDGEFYSVQIIGSILVYRDDKKKDLVLTLIKRTGSETADEVMEWERLRLEQIHLLDEMSLQEALKHPVRVYRSASGNIYREPKAALINTLLHMTDAAAYGEESAIEKTAGLLAPQLEGQVIGTAFPIGKVTIQIEELPLSELLSQQLGNGYISFRDDDLEALMNSEVGKRYLEQMTSRPRKYNAPVGTFINKPPYN